MAENQRPLIQANVVPVSGRNLSLECLRTLAKNEPDEFMRKIQAGVDQGKLKFSDFTDLKELYRMLAGVNVNVMMPDITGVQRAISTAAFPILTGTTVIKGINDAYQQWETIGGRLVTEIDDPKKVTTIASIHNQDKDQDEVKELDDFPEVGSIEEAVEIRHRKNGRKLTMSKEVITENEVANFMMKVNSLGKLAAKHVETLTLKRIYDYDGSASSPGEPYTYRPAGTGTALYSSTANTPGTRAPSGNRYDNNAFVDEIDLDNAINRLYSFVDLQDQSIDIPWSQVYLLAPFALRNKIFKVLNSEYVPGSVNEISNFGQSGSYNIPKERVIISRRLDDLSPSCWHLGAFKEQFIRKWKLRFEYVSLGQSTQAYLDSQVAAQFRVAWDCECGATDYVFTVQNLSGTTAPKDE